MPFPEVVDSSMLNTFRSCPRQFAESYVNQIGLPGTNIHLHFGACFARGLEVARKGFYIEGLSEEQAIEKGINSALLQWGDYEPPPKPKTFKTWGGLVELLLSYFKQWPMGSDVVRPAFGESAIEFSFGHPLDIQHPDHGGSVIYAGRFDMLGAIDRMPVVVDEKTTSRNFDSQWSSGWNIRGQFIGYIWACRVADIPVDKVLVRGCSIMSAGPGFIQDFVTVADHMIDRWFRQTFIDIKRMVESYKEGYWDYNFGDACKDPLSSRRCAYQTLCEASHREDWLQHFEKKPAWNPLHRPGGEP